jgi:hypothetical protein
MPTAIPFESLAPVVMTAREERFADTILPFEANAWSCPRLPLALSVRASPSFRPGPNRWIKLPALRRFFGVPISNHVPRDLSAGRQATRCCR